MHEGRNLAHKKKTKFVLRVIMFDSQYYILFPAKVNCLLQAGMGCLPVTDFSLSQDSLRIFRTAQRVAKFMMEYFLQQGAFQVTLNAVLVFKCVQARLWENSKHVAKQLEKIGLTLSTALVNADITTFEKIESTNPRELEMIMNRHPPFGSQVTCVYVGVCGNVSMCLHSLCVFFLVKIFTLNYK